jgi:hypothetical protein
MPFLIEDVEPLDELGYFFGAQHGLDALTPLLEQHISRLADAPKVLLSAFRSGTRINSSPSTDSGIATLARHFFSF